MNERQAKRPAGYRNAEANYPRMTFFLILGLAILTLGGGAFAYVHLAMVPDEEYQARTTKSKALLEDYITKSERCMADRQSVKAYRVEANNALAAYTFNLIELVYYCENHPYMTDHAGRLHARKNELALAKKMGGFYVD
jgi:hypothetical protein